jgi:amino acid transporter
MIFAFARDGGLPASKSLRRVSKSFRTPAVAIWVASVLAVLFTVYTPVYTTIAAVCTMFLYISYVIPITAGLIAFRRTWTKMGPFNLGALYPVLAVLSIIGVAVLLFIGVQPPNDQALTVTLGVLVLTALVWFGLERRRFQGPPTGELIAKRQAEILKAEAAIGEKD